jgi:hypothetical protein
MLPNSLSGGAKFRGVNRKASLALLPNQGREAGRADQEKGIDEDVEKGGHGKGAGIGIQPEGQLHAYDRSARESESAVTLPLASSRVSLKGERIRRCRGCKGPNKGRGSNER